MFYGVLNEGLIDYIKNKKKESKDRETYYARSTIKHIIAAVKGEEMPYDTSSMQYKVYIVADKIGAATPQELDKGYTKYCLNNLKDNLLEIITGEKTFEDAVKNSDYSKEELDKFVKSIPGFKENAPVCDIGSTGSYWYFFNSKDKKYYYIDGGGCYIFGSNTSIYSLLKELKIKPEKLSSKDINMYKEIYEELKSKD